MRQSGANDFFADPQWPLQLAELLAKREKWQAPALTGCFSRRSLVKQKAATRMTCRGF